MLALVTGGTGALGPAVVSRLCEAGFAVRVLSRGLSVAGLPADVEIHHGDVGDTGAVEAAVRDVGVVLHLAARLHVESPRPELVPDYERTNVDGTAAVVAAARRSGVRRVVLFSTIVVYGAGNGRVLTEETPPRPTSLYGRTKLAAEQVLLEAKREDGEPLGTVLRLASVYGARMKGNYRRLVEALARRRFIPIGDGTNRRTVVHVEDTAVAAVLAACHPRAAGRIYNVSDGRIHTIREIVTAVCEALGRKPPRLSLPLKPVLSAVSAVEVGLGLIGRGSLIGRMTIEKYLEDVAADGRLIQADLGFVPRYDLTTGWMETVLEMRRSGAIP